MSKIKSILLVVVGFFTFCGRTQTTIYPVSEDYYCLMQANGKGRLFVVNPMNGVMLGEGDWEGRIKGRTISISSDSITRPNSGEYLEFKNGVLTKHAITGVLQPEEPALERKPLETFYISDERIDEIVKESAQKDKWRQSDRLRFFSNNPNVTAVLLASLAIITFGLATKGRFALRIIFSLIGLASTIGLFLTDSRGGFVAFAVGIIPIAIIYSIRKFSWKKLIVIWATICIALAILIASPIGKRFSTNLFTIDKSNALRVDILQKFPIMVADSPNGVGLGNSGAIYTAWYKEEDDETRIRTLISSHLTYIAEFGKMGRLAYIAGWISLVCALLVFTIKHKDAIALSVWLALGIAAIFNIVLENPVVWILPILSLVPVALKLRRHSFVTISISAAVALLASYIALGIVERKGRSAERDVKIEVEKDIVKIGEGEVDVWVVADEFTLGPWTISSKDILNYYIYQDEDADKPKAIGFTENIDALPKNAKRLVLAGRTVGQYLERWNDETKRNNLCKAEALLLLSPSIPVTELPETLTTSTRMRACIGSLVVSQAQEYSTIELPPWARIVQGTMLYIPNWIKLAHTF